MAAFERVLEIDPLRPDTHMALAQLMMDARRPDEAVAYARRSLAVDPQRVMSHFILGAVARAAQARQRFPADRRFR